MDMQAPAEPNKTRRTRGSPKKTHYEACLARRSKEQALLPAAEGLFSSRPLSNGEVLDDLSLFPEKHPTG